MNFFETVIILVALVTGITGALLAFDDSEKVRRAAIYRLIVSLILWAALGYWVY